jgi:hypothetical protein
MENDSNHLKIGDVYRYPHGTGRLYTVYKIDAGIAYARDGSGLSDSVLETDVPTWLVRGTIERVSEVPTTAIECTITALDRAVLALNAADDYLFGTHVGLAATVRIDREFLTPSDLATLVIRLQAQLRQALVNAIRNR